HRHPHPFPTRRSSDLATGTRTGDDVGKTVPGHVAGSHADAAREVLVEGEEGTQGPAVLAAEDADARAAAGVGADDDVSVTVAVQDRKSTRLNSSHVSI